MMPEETCSICGLPKSLCTCKTIEKEEARIRISTEKRRFGKVATIIEGIEENPKELASKLKQKLACGGTYKNNRIELQGNHKDRLKEILVELGYRREQIEVV
jgi:translation initiation factor 1